MKCVTGKKCYGSLELAEESLVEHHIHFNHPSDSGPINVYLCEDCGYYHFTSKGSKNPILDKKASYIANQQLSRDWENKLR